MTQRSCFLLPPPGGARSFPGCGRPPPGGGSSRRGYGPSVFEQGGYACAYCGWAMDGAYESWLQLSIDHVIPVQANPFVTGRSSGTGGGRSRTR
jgi:hypothetical protein